jgi:hypothetical protein
MSGGMRQSSRNSPTAGSLNSRENREEAMQNTLDVDLEDSEQYDEIRLLGELMVLASESMGTLDAGTIDATLGLRRAPFPEQRQFG